MSDSLAESSEQQEFRVFLGNTPKDPYDPNNVFGRAAMSIGYPINFQESATDEDGKSQPDLFRVMVPTEEIAGKLMFLDKVYKGRLMPQVLTYVSRGASDLIRELLEGKEPSHWQIYPIEEKKKIDKRILEESFMGAYEKAEERPPVLLRNREKSPYRKGLEDTYNSLKEKGVRPITPEALAILAAQELKEILEKFPGLAP